MLVVEFILVRHAFPVVMASQVVGQPVRVRKVVETTDVHEGEPRSLVAALRAHSIAGRQCANGPGVSSIDKNGRSLVMACRVYTAPTTVDSEDV